MTDILFYATLVLNFVGFLFAGVFLWINISGSYTDLADRNASTLRISRVSMITSIAFSFLTCLLTESTEVTEAISRSALLYSIIAITWLAVILVCGITMLLTVISKKYYKPEISRAILFSSIQISMFGEAIMLTKEDTTSIFL